MSTESARILSPKLKNSGVDYWIRGVFEGGGVKGIAYKGALQQVLELNCWFEAVAGASAGAITAALVAAGYGPDDLDRPMDELLELLEFPGYLETARNLRRGQIYPRAKFRNKLDIFLREKLENFGQILPADEPLTFEKLYEITGIALYVCAADITRKEPIVFCRDFTPKCQVADAVVASSSIPFAFDGGMLTSENLVMSAPGPKGKTVTLRGFRTVVDGGVWTNFPMFVFRDRTFDNYMRDTLGLEKKQRTDSSDASRVAPVVGFQLHELVGEKLEGDEERRREKLRSAYEKVSFIDGPNGNETLAPMERIWEFRHPPKQVSSIGGKVLRQFTSWWNTAANLTDSRFHGIDVRRSQAPTRGLSRKLFFAVDNALGWMHKTIVTVSTCFFFLVLELGLLAFVLAILGADILEGWVEFRGSGATAWEFLSPLIALLVMLGIYVRQFVSFGIVMVGPVLLNWALLLPLRRTFVGLMGTLVATPGTSPWEHCDPDVIPLPIPAGLTTLSQKDDIEKYREQVLQWARDATKARLPTILRRWS